MGGNLRTKSQYGLWVMGNLHTKSQYGLWDMGLKPITHPIFEGEKKHIKEEHWLVQQL